MRELRAYTGYIVKKDLSETDGRAGNGEESPSTAGQGAG